MHCRKIIIKFKIMKKSIIRFLGILTALTMIAYSCDSNKEKPATPVEPEIPKDTTTQNYRLIETTFLEIIYWGDYYNSNTDSYTLYTGNAEHQGMYIESHGDFLMFSLITTLAENPNEINIPTGTFTFDPESTMSPMTIVGDKESALYNYAPDSNDDGYFEESVSYFSTGELTIEQLGEETYKVTSIVTLDNGEVIGFEYNGEILFSNAIEELYPEQISSDIEFEATFGELFRIDKGIYKLDLMSGDNPYESGQWGNRDRINLFIVTEDNPEKIKPGRYTIESAETDLDEYAQAGNFIIQSGALYWDGSFYFRMDNTTWEATYGFFNDGDIVIEYDEQDNIIVNINVTDLNGHTIKVSYTGPSTIIEQA